MTQVFSCFYEKHGSKNNERNCRNVMPPTSKSMIAHLVWMDKHLGIHNLYWFDQGIYVLLGVEILCS